MEYLEGISQGEEPKKEDGEVQLVTPEIIAQMPLKSFLSVIPGEAIEQMIVEQRKLTAEIDDQQKRLEELQVEINRQGNIAQIQDYARQNLNMDYAQKVLDELNNSGVRAEIDTRAEKIGYKIREAQMQKIPYMLVVGAKEEEENLVSVRSRFAGDEGQKSLDEFVASVTEEIATRARREVVKEEN